MSTLSQLISDYGVPNKANIEWLTRLQSEWQLVADLLFADLVLWVPTRDGSFIAVGHARPSSAATVFYRDISGEPIRKEWLAPVKQAFESGELVEQKRSDTVAGLPTRFSAIPVQKEPSLSGEDNSGPIAVITRHTNLSESRTPNKIQLNYVGCGNELLTMITEGTFPDYSSPTGRRRGAPRANDGLLRLDVDGNVTFASPNGLSAFSRLGIEGEIEGKSLAEVATKIVKEQSTVDESLPLVLTGKAPWRADLESTDVTLSVRAIPLMKSGSRTGAIVLCREITELRRQEQQLLTKDATIREIHHRVKNNLQTVASLMRIQMRRTTSDEAKEALDQAIRRVSAIALVHNTLAEGFSDEVNFDEVFESSMRLVGELATDSSREIKLRIDGKFGQLDSGLATPLAVALTEVVTNAASHGLGEHGGSILITPRQSAKQLTIEVEDNGVGIDKDAIGKGLGTQIIKTLIEGELRGKISWFSPKDGGTKVAISIPL
ncbi:MAG: PAS domain-containing protein [Actinobacteria bacterium]|uniref:histidine kinase n=1 Tax=freshwater metagenome TaxID=449393 RepID=A0A6J6CQW1_9ZZZZ|nr:PAS domain-containing protein [Actinomycetota bacterium]